jgi:hypothetical protein
VEGIARPETRSLLPAIGAGLVAAVVGGIVWGLIVKVSDYEIGFAALGVGFIVGTAVVLGAGGRRGLPYQVVAVVLALLGILLGKYLAFVWSVNDQAEEAGISVDLGLFSGDSFDLFTDRESGVWSWFDLLWIGIAAYIAFRATQPEQPERAEEPPPAE